MYQQTQINKAKSLGLIAFNKGIKCAPCLDVKLMAMLEGRAIGQTPDNEASSIAIMKAWETQWTSASLCTKQEKCFNSPTMTAFDKLMQLLSERDSKYTIKQLSLLAGRKASTIKNTLSKIRVSGAGLVCNSSFEYYLDKELMK